MVPDIEIKFPDPFTLYDYLYAHSYCNRDLFISHVMVIPVAETIGGKRFYISKIPLNVELALCEFKHFPPEELAKYVQAFTRMLSAYKP
jgi:hypothetical protein